MSTFNQLPHRVQFDRRLTPDDQVLLGGLLFVGYGNAVVHSSNEAIADACGLSISKVRRCLERVEHAGHILRETFPPTRQAMTGRAIHLRWLEDASYLEAIEVRPRGVHKTVGRPSAAHKGCAPVINPSPKGLRMGAQEGCAKSPERAAHGCAANELQLETTQKTPPHPPRGESQEGEGSLVEGKPEDTGTSRPSEDPDAERAAAAERVKVEVRAQAKGEGLAMDDAAKLASRAARAVREGSPEEAVTEAVEAAIERWGQGAGGARDLVAVVLKRFDEALEKAIDKARKEATRPKMTWAEAAAKITTALREADVDGEIQIDDDEIANVILQCVHDEIRFMLECNSEELAKFVPAMTPGFARADFWTWQQGVRILRHGDPVHARGYFKPSKREIERQKQQWEASDAYKVWCKWITLGGKGDPDWWFKDLARDAARQDERWKLAKLMELPDDDFVRAMDVIEKSPHLDTVDVILGLALPSQVIQSRGHRSKMAASSIQQPALSAAS